MTRDVVAGIVNSVLPMEPLPRSATTIRRKRVSLMAKPFYLIWQEGTTVLEGYDGANWIDGQLTFPIVFPASRPRRWRSR